MFTHYLLSTYPWIEDRDFGPTSWVQNLDLCIIISSPLLPKWLRKTSSNISIRVWPVYTTWSTESVSPLLGPHKDEARFYTLGTSLCYNAIMIPFYKIIIITHSRFNKKVQKILLTFWMDIISLLLNPVGYSINTGCQQNEFRALKKGALCRSVSFNMATP